MVRPNRPNLHLLLWHCLPGSTQKLQPILTCICPYVTNSVDPQGSRPIAQPEPTSHLTHYIPTSDPYRQTPRFDLRLPMSYPYSLTKWAPYVLPHSEPIYWLPICVLPRTNVISLYGIECIFPCLTRLANPNGPHLCLPILSPCTHFVLVTQLGPT